MNTKTTKNFTDEQLATMLQNGNIKAMGILYSRYYLLVFNKCLSFTKNSDDASDLAQDVMIRVFEKIKSFKGNAKFSTWLYAITFNYCTDVMRKAKKKRFLSLEDQFDLADESHQILLLTLELEQKETSAGLALSHLSQEEQELLLMKYEQNKTIQELQALYGLSASAIKMRLMRARAKAADIYKDVSTQVQVAA